MNGLPLSPTELGLFIGQAITAIGLAVTVLVALINKKARTPADENESMRLGNEFLRGLLADAKLEREELRKTIEELKNEAHTSEETIRRLNALLRRKDDRITQLQDLIERLAEKLNRGEPITLSDLIHQPALEEQP